MNYKILLNPWSCARHVRTNTWVLTRQCLVSEKKPYYKRFFRGQLLSLLLDSRLITRVRFENYNTKIVEFGDYIQVYYYPYSKHKNLEHFDIDNLKKKSSNITGKILEDTMLSKNIIRSKLQCQRIAKANSNSWTSFITLTYSDNFTDLKSAKNDLSFFIKNIKKIKKDLKYIAIPEFQKRGAIHFHLLTNLSLQDNNIIIPQKDNPNYYDVKYWNKGFTSFENVTGDVKKVVGYISKYMTEDNCDNRLFGFRKFSTSQNLEKPKEYFISLDHKYSAERRKFNKLLKDYEIIYENTYLDNLNFDVNFIEFKKVNIIGGYEK